MLERKGWWGLQPRTKSLVGTPTLDKKVDFLLYFKPQIVVSKIWVLIKYNLNAKLRKCVKFDSLFNFNS